MLDTSTLLAAAGVLAGMLLTYWLGTASTAAKDRRDLCDRLCATLRARQNFSSPASQPTDDDFHRLLSLTPVMHRHQLRAAVRDYQQAESAWRQDGAGQPMLLDPGAAQAARDRLLGLLS